MHPVRRKFLHRSTYARVTTAHPQVVANDPASGPSPRRAPSLARMVLAVLVVTALAATSVACTRSTGRDTASGSASGGGPGPITVTEAMPDTGADPMIVALETAFTKRNANAGRVSILEFRREGAGGGANLVLARGAQSGVSPGGNPENELFGVFVFDDSLRHIRRTVALFPSPRVASTHVRIDRTNADSVFLLAWDPERGDTLLRAGYRWTSAAQASR